MWRTINLLVLVFLVGSFDVLFSQPATTSPPPLSSHVMTFHSGIKQILIFAGTDHERQLQNRLWGWDGKQWHLHSSADGPPARLHSAIAYDSRRDRLIIYGGIKNRTESYDDLWEWDGKQWQEISLATEEAKPGIRDHHAMAYFPRTGKTVLFGGQNQENEFLADTWTWDGKNWLQITTSGPEARSTHRLAYDPIREMIVLTCGWGADNKFNDYWEWNGRNWSEHKSENPPLPRGATRFAVDHARQVLILFGGPLRWCRRCPDLEMATRTMAVAGHSWSACPKCTCDVI